MNKIILRLSICLFIVFFLLHTRIGKSMGRWCRTLEIFGGKKLFFRGRFNATHKSAEGEGIEIYLRLARKKADKWYFGGFL